MKALYSIGIGTREVPDLLRDLQTHGIEMLIDVRSSPYSSHKPTFNRDQLRPVCEEAGLEYVHWPALGGFPQDTEVLRNGHVDYRELARQIEFRNHLNKIRGLLAEEHAVAVLCSEGRPEECHRSKCIGVELHEQGIDVLHIDPDGSVVSQEDVMERLTGGQFSLPGMEPVLRSKRIWEPNRG